MSNDCDHNYEFDSYCGAKVCTICGDHKDLARCFCGWTQDDTGDGRKQLLERGERIEPEPGVGRQRQGNRKPDGDIPF